MKNAQTEGDRPFIVWWWVAAKTCVRLIDKQKD